MSPSAQGKTIAIVQARMSSSRLPGKVLLPLAGHAVLYHLHERLSQIPRVDRIVLATTAEPADQPIVDFANAQGFEVFAYTGSADDLLSRYLACGAHYQADIIVMVDGDCPLLHPPTIERMTQALVDHPEMEYCRIESRSIEGGVAVLRLRAFQKIAELIKEAAHREHATLFIMENPDLFSIIEVPCEQDFRDIKHRLWLDTPADYEFLTTVYDRLYSPGNPVDLREVVRWLKRDSALRKINAHVSQKGVRERGVPLCMDVSGMDTTSAEQARNLATLLSERYHAGVRVNQNTITPDETARWQQKYIPLSETPLKDTEGLLSLRSASAFSLQFDAPSESGAPRIQMSLEAGACVEAHAAMLAAHLGYHEGNGPGFVPTIHSSANGSHLIDIDCPLCKSAKKQVVWSHSSGVHAAVCEDCGHVFLSRRPNTKAIEESYREFEQSYPDDYLQDPNNVIFSYAHHRQLFIAKHATAPVHSCLEIGCGYGHCLEVLGDKVFRAGIEPSSAEVRFARRHFRFPEIWECNFQDVREKPPTWPGEGFELVSSYHVLEHLEYPMEALEMSKRFLRPGGWILVAVPNLNTMQADLIELGFICKGLHLHSFTPATLASTFEGQGFEIVAGEDEPATAMLPSSYLLLARRVQCAPAPKALPRVQDSLALARDFFARLDHSIDCLRRAFAQWAAVKKSVAIYGGGIHTQSLLEMTGINLDPIGFIVDDDPVKQGKLLFGKPIISFNEAMGKKIDVLVISSLASESSILKKLDAMRLSTMEIVGIYRDLINLTHKEEKR